MATILRPGTVVNGYEILGPPHRGGMAISYPAKSPSGEKVFFKQYKSPSVTVPWYKAYVAYQAEIKRRVESSEAARFCYRFVDFFEAKAGSQCYFQVFEFVERGGSLATLLEGVRSGKSPMEWDRRLIFARVLMAGIAKLHQAKVVHCDLKPDNIQMIADPSVKAGYALKVIDMDYSILADKRAPWHGQIGYIGSPNYMSPEHLASPPPLTASDVFTCALILYELLAQGNPYASDDPESYRSAALAHRAPQPKFQGPMPNEEAVAEVLHSALSPSASRRPGADDVLKVLRAESRAASFPAHPMEPPAAVVPPSSTVPPEAPSYATKSPAESEPSIKVDVPMRLADAAGQEIRIGVRTDVGKNLLRRFGEDARYADDLQFTLERDTTGGWAVLPRAGTTNETLLNGKAITGQSSLKDGDVLSVGREAKGVSKLPLTVRIG
jgi:serine/threonine protein kinase